MGTAIVTGASAGIGAAFARRLAERGDDLVLVARRSDRLEQLAGACGVRVEVLAADLARPDDLARVAQRAAAADVTLLVNNAGINGYGPFEEMDPGVLTGVLAVNVTAPAVLARAAVPGMLRRGGGAELAESPVRVQALCPGYTATEFHMTTGTDPVEGTAPADQPRAMAAEDVVQASLLALDAGEVVCAPGLDDPEAVGRLIAAEAE